MASVSTDALRTAVQAGVLPLAIRLARTDCRLYDQADTYFVSLPRLSYLSDSLWRLRAFFADVLIDEEAIALDGWFDYEEVPLKWHYPLGLLYDLYHQSRAPPFPLTVHFSTWPEESLVRPDAEGRVLHDAFINSVKEADFLRNGSAKQIMSLSRADSLALWKSVQSYDIVTWNPIYQRLINLPFALRHVPIKLYLPIGTESVDAPGRVRVLQFLVPAMNPSTKQPQTLGNILHRELPLLFSSKHSLAQPVLHGATLSLETNLPELMQFATYLDGWLHMTISLTCIRS